MIISSGIRCREYRDYFIQRQAQPAADGGEPPAAAGLTWTVSAAHAEQLAPGAGTWPLLVLAALLDGHGIPGTVLTAPAACQYLAGEDAARPPDPQRAWSALLVLERAGLVAVDAASAPPAVWVSPALQAAVRAVAPPDLLDRAARAAADALVQAWPQYQPRSWLAAHAAVVRGEPAAGRRGRAVGRRRLPSAAAGGRAAAWTAAGLAGPAVAWWRELAADSERLLGPAHPDTLVAGGQLAGALLAAGQAAEAVTWFGWVPGRPRRACSGPITPPPSRPRSAWAARWWPPASPARRCAVLEEAAAHSERVRGPGDAGHGGRAGRVRRRVAWPRARPPRRSAATSGCWPTASACTGPDIPAPWPPGCGWPAPAWPRARPRTPSASTRRVAGRPGAGPRPGSPGHAGGPRRPGRRLRCRRADGRRAAAAPGGVRRVRARLRRRSPRHPGPPRGPGPRLLPPPARSARR